MDPFRELPYGPAACDSRIRGRTHVSTRPRAVPLQEILLAPTGASTHVHDDDVTGTQFGHEHFCDVGLEGIFVDRPIKDERRDHAARGQPGEECRRFPMTVRYADAQTLPFWGPAVAPRHIGRSPGLVDEDEPVRVEVGLTVEPGFPPRQDVGTILLRGMRRLFLRVILWRRQKRQSAATLTWAPCAASFSFSSGRVISLVSASAAWMSTA